MLHVITEEVHYWRLCPKMLHKHLLYRTLYRVMLLSVYMDMFAIQLECVNVNVIRVNVTDFAPKMPVRGLNHDL